MYKNIDVTCKIVFPKDRLAGRCLDEACRQMVREFGISTQNVFEFDVILTMHHR